MGYRKANVSLTLVVRGRDGTGPIRLSAVSAVIFAVLLCWTDLSVAQSAKTALRALEKLESGVEQGITYQSYIRLLKNAGYEISRLDAIGKVRAGNGTFRYLKAAMQAYETAGEIWSAKFEKSGDPEYQRNHEWFLSVREFEEVSRRYPFLNDPELRRAEVIGGDPLFTNVYREAAVSALWREASRELDRARAALKKPSLP